MITDRVVERVLDNRKLNIAKIILYGSYARGDAQDDSDIDIMILCRDDRDRVKEYEHEIWREIDHVGFDNDIMIQTVLQSKDFFDYWEDALPFYRNIKNESVVLYE